MHRRFKRDVLSIFDAHEIVLDTQDLLVSVDLDNVNQADLDELENAIVDMSDVNTFMETDPSNPRSYVQEFEDAYEELDQLEETVEETVDEAEDIVEVFDFDGSDDDGDDDGENDTLLIVAVAILAFVVFAAIVVAILYYLRRRRLRALEDKMLSDVSDYNNWISGYDDSDSPPSFGGFHSNVGGVGGGEGDSGLGGSGRGTDPEEVINAAKEAGIFKKEKKQPSQET